MRTSAHRLPATIASPHFSPSPAFRSGSLFLSRLASQISPFGTTRRAFSTLSWENFSAKPRKALDPKIPFPRRFSYYTSADHALLVASAKGETYTFEENDNKVTKRRDITDALNQGASLEVLTHCGKPPLHLMVNKLNRAALLAVLREDAHHDLPDHLTKIKDDKGRTLLTSLAAKLRGQIEKSGDGTLSYSRFYKMFEDLCNAGANLNIPDDNGDTALSILRKVDTPTDLIRRLEYEERHHPKPSESPKASNV